MISILKYELYRGFKSREFFVSLFMSVGLVIIDFITFYHDDLLYGLANQQVAVIEAWIGTNYKFAYNSLLYILLPILVALPYAASYYEELQSGYIKNVCIKTSRKYYYISKYCTVFILAFIAIGIPLIASAMLCMVFYPIYQPEKLTFLVTAIVDYEFMSEIYNSNPTLYMVLYIILDGVFSGLIAVFSICITECVESKFSAIVTPFTIYILWSMLLNDSEGNWSIMGMLNPNQPYGNDGWRIAVVAMIVFLVTIIWMTLKGRRKDIL